MARPPTPTQLKVVRGTTRKDRANPAEPTPTLAGADVRPPAWLRVSRRSRRAWRDLVPLLRGMHVLTEADRVALALLCDALASYVEAKQLVVEEGSTYETVNESGGRMVRKHPGVEIGAESVRFAKLMLSEFGLTPAARAKVSRVDPGEKDPLETWMEGSGS